MKSILWTPCAYWRSLYKQFETSWRFLSNSEDHPNVQTHVNQLPKWIISNEIVRAQWPFGAKPFGRDFHSQKIPWRWTMGDAFHRNELSPTVKALHPARTPRAPVCLSKIYWLDSTHSMCSPCRKMFDRVSFSSNLSSFRFISFMHSGTRSMLRCRLRRVNEGISRNRLLSWLFCTVFCRVFCAVFWLSVCWLDTLNWFWAACWLPGTASWFGRPVFGWWCVAEVHCTHSDCGRPDLQSELV